MQHVKKKYLLFLAASGMLPGCSNKLNIAADYKEVTIVYGLLNQAESVHYVQVFKGFLDENINALSIAGNADSVFYDDSLEVKIDDGSRVHILERIIGTNRDKGIFIDSPNYVYRFTGRLLENAIYKLTVVNKRTNHIVTAQTPIVKDFVISRPSALVEINLATSSPNEVVWRTAENGKVYQLTMRFYYEQWLADSPSEKDILFIDWLLFDNYVSEEREYKFIGPEFLIFLGSQLQANPNIMRRALDAPLEFRFYVGAADLYEYIRAGSAQTGITSLQVSPEYTNVHNGLGIFSSRFYKYQRGIRLSTPSLDSLSCGRFTKDLNFVNSINCH